MLPKQRPTGQRHISAASVDTNASAIAESTISLGLSRFPEPPSSIPSTPLRGNFDSPSSSVRSFNGTLPRTAPLRSNKLQDKLFDFPLPSNPFSNRSPSFNPIKSNEQSVPRNSGPPQPSSSSRIISPHDWHDGASSIDVDAAEDRLLPTSFITSLLQENKDLRKSKRASYASEAFSGISEMTYPPVMNRSRNTHIPSSSVGSIHHRPQDSRPPPSSYTHPSAMSNRISGDSETLHSVQDYSAIVKPSRIGQAARVSVVGIAPATLHSISNASQISSTHDSDTIGSITKGYQKGLSTMYETGDELTIDYKNFNSAYSPALPSTGIHRRFLPENSRQDPLLRDSIHSHQSAAPSFISRVSEFSYRIFNWKKVKPLPPVPHIPHIPLQIEHEYRKNEESTPLPDLVNRAGVLRDLLDRGQHPHNSMSSYQGFSANSDPLVYESEAAKSSLSQVSHLSPLHKERPPSIHFRPSQGVLHGGVLRTRTRKQALSIIIVIFVLAAIGAAVGVTVGKKKSPNFNCSDNLTGSLCNIDTTCICTSTSGCNGLARSIINLLPIMNQAFGVDISSAAAYSSIWLMQGSPSTRNCADQALLIDVGKNLNPNTFPNRTEWAQAALLWNAVQTQDIASVEQLQRNVQALPWNNIASTDGPVAAEASFLVASSGFVYNFASQTLGQPSASFVALGQPPNAQIAKVNLVSSAALDRMYTYAQASATQRETALKNYWTSVLLQNAHDLPLFKTAISISPIMLPFNASSPPIRNLYGTSPTTSFPPPLSCFPGLSGALMQKINSVESSVFGLKNTTIATQFNPTCYSGRPIYGVLNILRLRLPFPDSDMDVARQAVTLTRDAGSRAILYSGPLFSSISNVTTSPSPVTLNLLDPRQYGTLGLLDHVILQYLSSIPDINIATALVKFVLDTTNRVPVPPDLSSPLYKSLPSLPKIEVAVFGDIQGSDLTTTVSPFTTSSGSLFFGSPDGAVLRNWTINSGSGSILWTQNTTSPLIVRDKSLDPSIVISQVWDATSKAILFNVTSVSLTNVTASLQSTNNFTPQ